jgi:nitroreductase
VNTTTLLRDDVIEAVAGRRSVRRFLPTEVDQDVIEAILATASRAPSGTEADMTSLEYEYVPKVLKEPYRSRRRKIGFDLYAKYGIDRDDMAGRKAAMLRNYDFFGAPVGIFITMERDMALGAWLDCGMFMQNIMTVARAYGLETCPQQAWCDVGAVVHRELRIPNTHIILSGMALGIADHEAPENSLRSERVSVAEFTTWHR